MKPILDFLKYQFATGFGLGLSPYAPGTLGSLLGLVIVWLLWPASALGQLLLVGGFFVIGLWAGGWLADAENTKDPGHVVIDEVAGQLLTFLWLPLGATGSLKVLLVGFVLFRIFDIWKPYPVNRLENGRGGYGIMLDDVMAAVYANLILQIWLRIF